MAKKKSAKGKGAEAWRAAALSYPETVEVDSCNKKAFKARDKSFLFLGVRDTDYNIMVRLGDSRGEAEKMAAKDPDNISVGPHWITATFASTQALPAGLIRRWIDESWRLLAPKKLVASLD